MLLYLALVSAVAYTLWGCLLKYNPVSQVTIFGFLTPVFGVVLSALLLSEGDALGWQALGALALVCLGILLVNRPAKPQKQRQISEYSRFFQDIFMKTCYDRENRFHRGGNAMKKTLHTIAVILGVVSGLAALVAPIVYVLRRLNAKHAAFPEK